MWRVVQTHTRFYTNSNREQIYSYKDAALDPNGRRVHWYGFEYVEAIPPILLLTPHPTRQPCVASPLATRSRNIAYYSNTFVAFGFALIR